MFMFIGFQFSATGQNRENIAEKSDLEPPGK